jgi:hypothetical protein
MVADILTNQPPAIGSTPVSPASGADAVDGFSISFQWTCADAEGDDTRYDVYLQGPMTPIPSS